MVDFRKLVSKRHDVDITDLTALFESLDRQTSHIELRTVQQQALRVLSSRRGERDLILKISTGLGKTAIGLLYLWSYMEERQQPVVYLCPTRQLREQVRKESYKLGMNSVIYDAGESHPHVDGISGKAIIICTYDKLFNAKTTFNRSDVMLRPCAMVLDDAHAGVEEIRDCFTLHVSGNTLYSKLMQIFDESCDKYKSSVWRDIRNEDPNKFIEIPYWIWKPLLPAIEEAISGHSEDDGFKFIIPHLQDVLRWCRCVVSGRAIEIVPDILPVHKSEAFTQCDHRLFMSATLADDSVLIRELSCDLSAAEKPVVPDNDRGMGERMVLAPSLVDSALNREWVMEICAKLAKRINVVVLSPSESRANEWKAVGAEVYLGDKVNEVVDNLTNPSVPPQLVVFVQRYDGIDLPDGSCRVLVMDGMPLGEGILDRYDSGVSGVAGGTRNRLIYRIEQGMGRCVRSHADYAVILLAGHEVAHFIAKHDVLSAMNPDTQAQLRLAVDLSKLAEEDGDGDPEKAVIDMIRKCLKRDDGWKQYYNETVREGSQKDVRGISADRLYLANMERAAFEAVFINNHEKAIEILRAAIDDHIADDPVLKGWYLQRIANYMYDVDPGQALEIQNSACENNQAMFCPPGVIKRPQRIEDSSVQLVIYEWLKQFANPNGAIATIQELRTQLSFDMSPSILEQALCDLAQLLGGQGSRPENEYGEGPDVLWLWPDLSLVIEAKNQNQDALHKKDAEQLLASLEWFKNSFPKLGEPSPIVVAKVTICDSKAYFPQITRIITPEKMSGLLDNLEQFYRKMIAEPLLCSKPKSLAQLQQTFFLLPEQFIGNYTEKTQE